MEKDKKSWWREVDAKRPKKKKKEDRKVLETDSKAEEKMTRRQMRRWRSVDEAIEACKRRMVRI